MQNFYKKGYNPVVETMNNNYLNTYSVSSQSTNETLNSETQPNTENASTNNNNLNNFNNITGLLNMLGGNNANMGMIQNLLNNNGANKNELIMNLLNNLNKPTAQNTKRTASLENGDFSNLVGIDEYNFID